MAHDTLRETVIELLEAPAASHGFELVEVEQAGGTRQPIVRVYLDKIGGGVTLDEVAEATSWVSAILDDADPVSGSYTLEVSSPGIDRPLRTREDFIRFSGEEVSLKTHAYSGRSSWKGTLAGVEGDNVLLVTENKETVTVPYADIKKARLKGHIDFSKGKEGA